MYKMTRSHKLMMTLVLKKSEVLERTSSELLLATKPDCEKRLGKRQSSYKKRAKA